MAMGQRSLLLCLPWRKMPLQCTCAVPSWCHCLRWCCYLNLSVFHIQIQYLKLEPTLRLLQLALGFLQAARIVCASPPPPPRLHCGFYYRAGKKMKVVCVVFVIFFYRKWPFANNIRVALFIHHTGLFSIHIKSCICSPNWTKICAYLI